MKLLGNLLKTCFWSCLRGVNACIPKQKNTLAFIPHGGCYSDGNSLFNYKSDNALSFLHFLITKYKDKYEYRLAVDCREIEDMQRRLDREYPRIKIRCFVFFAPETSKIRRFRNLFAALNALCRCKYVFTSQALPVPYSTKRQKFIYLGYYACNFKNDYLPMYLKNAKNYNRTYDIMAAPSLLFGQINSHIYNIPLHKFVTLGMSRNDELLKIEKNEHLEKRIAEAAGYPVKHVFLYTPTHRDYEEGCSATRSILGFDVDPAVFGNFLRTNEAIIICKIHSKQNPDVLSAALPEGVVLHRPNEKYGLCELMQRADCLITDYTSTYFDFLLLDRPVLFNFYDFATYEKTRGFSFDPLDSIIAGEIFTDETSFYRALGTVRSGNDPHREKRRFVRDLVHKYQDTEASQRIYSYLFHD